MKSLPVILYTAFFVFHACPLFALQNDTIYISPKDINPGVLKEGNSRYLVYFKMKKGAPRTQTQFWTRTLKRITQNGEPVLVVSQEWEDKDSVIHTVNSVCNAETLKPITHDFWWKSRGSVHVNFENNSVQLNDIELTDEDTARQKKNIWAAFKSRADNYFLNWHLDMEVFPTLPYKNGVTFIIPFYDPGTSAPFEKVAYTVTGSARLTGYNDQKIDCWLLVHESQGNKEVYWISKKTKEVLKLEQEINGSFYRYKIKLGFSA